VQQDPKSAKHGGGITMEHFIKQAKKKE